MIVKSTRKNKGITLIALIITIIILLILAGIAISQLTENGLLDKSKVAKERSKNAENLQNQTLYEYETEVEKYIDVNTRDENTNQSSKTTILFDGTIHPDGPIVNAGTEDGTSERIFSDDVKNYDLVLVYYGHINSDTVYQPNIFHKIDFNTTIFNHINGYSATFTRGHVYIRIDTERNRIIFEQKGDSNQTILKVVGLK